MNGSSDSSRPGRESHSEVVSGPIAVRVGFRIESEEALAGGPIQASWISENRGEDPVFLAAGMSGGRPAYLSFTGELLDPRLELRDPEPGDPLALQGLSTAIEIAPGARNSRRVTLNQYLTLEDLPHVLEEGHSGFLSIRWKVHLAAGPSVESAMAKRAGLLLLEGALGLEVARSDERLERLLGRLADSIRQDWEVISTRPVERLDDVAALTSLRIPAAAAYLEAIAEHPVFEIRIAVQRALEHLAEIGNEEGIER